MNDWMEIKKECPKSNGAYLVTAREEVFLANYINSDWEILKMYKDTEWSPIGKEDITHWMKLPAAKK